MTFQSLNLIEPILKAVNQEGYTTPTPIQERAIPYILNGRDLLGCAQTGTGKTAAFAMPMLQLLNKNKLIGKSKKVRALIVTPTRELAVQIGESFDSYGRNLKISNTVIFGGVNQNPQIATLKNGVDIIIATPGRLLDLMNQGFVNLKDIEIFVLDEADRMLDMGFIHDIKKLLNVIPKQRQSLFFSATMPPEIVKLSGSILQNPEQVTVTPISSTVDIIQQKVLFVDKENKIKLLLEILENKKIRTALVFTRTKHGADKVVRYLLKNNIRAAAIHGNKAQNARQTALNSFKAQKTRVLVATDIASRGIDVDNLEYVINFEIPNISETYVHRIGRTGRAGANGTAISFCDVDEKVYLRDIEKLISKKIDIDDNHSFPLKKTSTEVTIFKPKNSKLDNQHKVIKHKSSDQPKGAKPKLVVKLDASKTASEHKKKWYAKPNRRY